MFAATAAFSGFSVDDIQKARQFYTETLGLKLKDEKMGLHLQLPGGGEVFVYEKPNHQPATYTMLNFVVEDIDAAVSQLAAQGVQFAHYDGMGQDEKGIARGSHGGPTIAWFTDPAGNIVSLIGR